MGVKVNGTALAIAEKMVDILIATGATNGTLADNGVNVAVKGLAALAYKAQVSESDLDTALKAVLDAKASGADLATLIGEDTGKSARTIANEELTKQLIPESAKDSLDTLTEIAQWIQDHPDDASAMNAAIAKLNSIVAGIGGDSDTYATIIAAIDGKIAEGDQRHRDRHRHRGGGYAGRGLRRGRGCRGRPGRRLICLRRGWGQPVPLFIFSRKELRYGREQQTHQPGAAAEISRAGIAGLPVQNLRGTGAYDSSAGERAAHRYHRHICRPRTGTAELRLCRTSPS